MYTNKDKCRVLEEAIRVTKRKGYILIAYCMNEATMIQFTFKAGKIWDCINNHMLELRKMNYKDIKQKWELII